MDCNKDEAFRAKEIAEKKFATNDLAGAKRFALKANSLYPGLAGISQMLAIIDVYMAAESKVDGEADWYGVLGVDSRVDDETMRKQYRKMALTLHPDKNNSVGADGAFKLLSEAWKLLSNKGDRAAYDQRRRAKAFPKVPTSGGGSAAPSGAYGFNQSTKGGSAAPSGAYCSKKSTGGDSAASGAYGSKKSAAKKGSSTSATANGSNNFSRKTTSTAGSNKHSAPAGRSSAPAPPVNPKPQTFWTVCYRCKICYEYLRLYLNYNILCPCCRQPFAARETAPPSFDAKPLASWNFPQQQQNSSAGTKGKSANNGAAEFRSPPCNYTCYQWDSVSRTFSAKVGQQSNERMKRGREEAEAATKRDEALRRKV